jgi:hypothetical protein
MFQDWGNCVDTVTKVPTLRCLPVVFHNAVSALLMFVGITAVFFIILAGFKFATSGGDQKKIQDGKKIMTFAIVGVLIVLFSFAIIYFIGYATNTNCVTKFDLLGCK